MTTKNTITLLRQIFSTFGLPRILVSDNGPTFKSYEFKRFLQESGIIHSLSAPYHPATNGSAERYVQTFKQSLRALKGNTDKKEEQLAKFLLNYRRTPHTVTKVSPSFLMFNREIRTRLDLLKPFTKVEERKDAKDVRCFQVGERVQCRDYIHKDKWEFGRIHKRLGKIHYLVKLDNSHIWKRHLDQIIGIAENIPVQPENNSIQSDCFPYEFTVDHSLNSNNASISNNATATAESTTGLNDSVNIPVTDNIRTLPVNDSLSNLPSDIVLPCISESRHPDVSYPGLRRSKRITKQPNRLTYS